MPNEKSVTSAGGTAAPVSAKPQVDGFTLKAKLTSTPKALADALRTITFLEVAQSKDSVEAVYVEKRDINKVPYLFSILRVDGDKVEVIYSVPSGMAPHRRRLDVVMYLLNILSVIEPHCRVDNRIVYQLIENVLKELTESITPEYAKLYTSYDTLKKEVEDLRKRVARLTDENTALTTRNFEIKNKSDELKVRMAQLENIPDDALKSRVQEWIAEHNGEINIYEFCKVHKTIESRVEDVLNRLVSDGYLELVQ